MTMELVSTVTVGAGGAASIEFTGIPQTGQDLLVVTSLKNSSQALSQTLIRFNNDSASNYTWRWLRGDGSATSSMNSTTWGDSSAIYASYHDNVQFNNNAIYISNYASSTAKSVSSDGVEEQNTTAAYQLITAGSWSGTAAITSLSVLKGSGTGFAQYSTASLYTISTSGASGASVA